MTIVICKCVFGQRTQRGRCPVEYRGNLCVHPSVCLSVCPPHPASQPLKGSGQMDGQMDGRMHRFPLYSTEHRPLRFRCPAYLETAIAMLKSRARVPLTIYCLWAIILSFALSSDSRSFFWPSLFLLSLTLYSFRCSFFSPLLFLFPLISFPPYSFSPYTQPFYPVHSLNSLICSALFSQPPLTLRCPSSGSSSPFSSINEFVRRFGRGSVTPSLRVVFLRTRLPVLALVLFSLIILWPPLTTSSVFVTFFLRFCLSLFVKLSPVYVVLTPLAKVIFSDGMCCDAATHFKRSRMRSSVES